MYEDETMDPHLMILERALHLLFVKGSEGDGELRLNAAETAALADYVRQLRRYEPAKAMPDGNAIPMVLGGKE